MVERFWTGGSASAHEAKNDAETNESLDAARRTPS